MILIISKDEGLTDTLSNILRCMGIPSFGVSPEEAAFELSPMYNTVCMINPEAVPFLGDYIFRLHRCAPGIPIIAITDRITDESDSLFYGRCAICDSISELYRTVRGAIESRLYPKEEYKLCGIDAGYDLLGVKYFDTPMTLTKTETLILRYLITAYPTPRSAKDILKYTFKKAKMPEPANVRTHISSINKKFRAKNGRNIIKSSPEKGYVLMTPELNDSAAG